MNGPDWGAVEAAFMNQARRMGEPDWHRIEQSFAYAADRIANAGEMSLSGASTGGLWAVVYKLAPFRDGNMWCVLLGEDLQVGICGFGSTPSDAIYDFEKAMTEKAGA